MVEPGYTAWNPALPEDGMVRCPRKAGAAIAVGRCVSMRSAVCGMCMGRLLEAPPRMAEGAAEVAHHKPLRQEILGVCHFSASIEAADECPVDLSQKAERRGCAYQRKIPGGHGKLVKICSLLHHGAEKDG